MKTSVFASTIWLMIPMTSSMSNESHALAIIRSITSSVTSDSTATSSSTRTTSDYKITIATGNSRTTSACRTTRATGHSRATKSSTKTTRATRSSTSSITNAEGTLAPQSPVQQQQSNITLFHSPVQQSLSAIQLNLTHRPVTSLQRPLLQVSNRTTITSSYC